MAKHFPWKHVTGFVLSIILTLLALWVALYSGFSLTALYAVVIIFAVLQAVLQLLMFMHVNEGGSGKIQSGTMLYAAFIAVVVVAGSVWVMASHHSH